MPCEQPLFSPFTTNMNLHSVNRKRTSNPCSISIMFYPCLVPLTQTMIQMPRMMTRREETRSKSRQWFSTVTPTRSRNRSNWGVSRLWIALGQWRGGEHCLWRSCVLLRAGSRSEHAVVWDRRVEEVSSSDDDMPYNWARRRGRSRGRAAPSVTATANLPGRARGRGRARAAGYPRLGSKPHREGSKSQNILLKWFLTSFSKNCFLADTQQMIIV